ncbi:hypothetical protein ACFL3D_03260 [Candidatus Omnitrophota bacterium]
MIYLAIFFLSALTLTAELLLTRVFDVIMTPNMSYMVITCVMFSFGLAGVFVSIKPIKQTADISLVLSRIIALFAISIAAIHPVINILPFDYEFIFVRPFEQLFYFFTMYLTLILPFFFTGLFFSILFLRFSHNIQRLYFWDLSGAAIGCIVFIPFLPVFGPAGILYFISGLAFYLSGIVSQRKKWIIASIIVGSFLILLPLLKLPGFYDFVEHTEKRGVKQAREEKRILYSRWDPISKIDIIDMQKINPDTGTIDPYTEKLHIAYDGGSQSSHFFNFDGKYKKLRDELLIDHRRHVWNKGVLASHYLKRDSEAKVLIIGSAGGQETKTALAFGASYVDAVEMVGTVVELGQEKYADYNGNIFNDSRVNVLVGEGRSFLRSHNKEYDIIQIYSNHTTSSIAAGTGAMATTYLQTADAYIEYFKHLSNDGILHINHHVYPRMIAIAAKAWNNLGKTDFIKHVLVYKREGKDPLPTVLIKMSQWETEEIETLNKLFLGALHKNESRSPYHLVEDPLSDDNHFLSKAFYLGSLPESVTKRCEYNVFPSTDDKPYFNFLRKSAKKLFPDPSNFLNDSTADVLNSQLRKYNVPMDIIHFLVVGITSLFFAVIFIILPLMFSNAGKVKWSSKWLALSYFSCLGAGFIMIELVLIQLFMKLIGFPLYVYSTVIFTILLSAGCGSFLSSKLRISINKWHYPFIGIIVMSICILLGYQKASDLFLTMHLWFRICATAGMIFPLGFFLGMPFPLGILTIEKQPEGAIAWAWGMNGLFTVVGGMSSVLLSIFFGFRITLLCSVFIYCIAFFLYSRIRKIIVL